MKHRGVVNAPLGAMKPAAHRRLMVGDMARAIFEGGADLGDEAAVILSLTHTHRAADIDALLDDAIEAARALTAQMARPE